jgi:antitoxin (DNA-binding transcriptional repressor) of toxin-antitoxin stability system
MEKISKSALKSQMLEYFRRVGETGEEVVVTDDNEPVLRIIPIRRRVPMEASLAQYPSGNWR